MKKLIFKLMTAIVLVAFLVTGVVLSVSAKNDGAIQHEYKTTGEGSTNHVNNLLFFSGTRFSSGKSTDLWGNGFTSVLTASTPSRSRKTGCLPRS